MPQNDFELELAIRYRGGDADRHALDFYDGASSMFGFAKSLAIASNYLVTGKVSYKATAARGVKLLMKPSREGSFEQFIMLLCDNIETVTGLILSPLALRHFIKYSFSSAVGVNPDPPTQDIANIVSRTGDMEALTDALEGPLKEAHRTVYTNENARVDLRTENGGMRDLITFNQNTASYLHDRIISDRATTHACNVASYNVNSKRGRLYLLDEGHTVPFEIAKTQPSVDTAALSWSLDQVNVGRGGELSVVAKKITASNGDLKKLILQRIQVR